jgi:hypothetical protein
MKRVYVFLLLGPAAVALTVTLVAVAAGAPGAIAQLLLPALFFLTFPVAALAGAADGYMARTVPIPVRAPLTAFVGAAVTFALMRYFVPPSELMIVPLGGAICMGVCSLLSHEYGGRQKPVAPEQGLPRPG